MSATDELRRLLDERGVEWKDHIHVLRGSMEVQRETLWGQPKDATSGKPLVGVYCSCATEMGDGRLFLEAQLLTPEQAVEATLGRGTCRYTPEFMHSYWDGDDEEHETDEGDPDGCCCICDQCGFEMMTGEDGWFYETEGPHGGLLYEPRFNFCPGCGRRVVAGDRADVGWDLDPVHPCPSCGRRVER